MSDPFIPASVTVEALQQESHDVFTLSVCAPSNYAGFTPGQFNMLYLPGRGESAISISGDPGNNSTITHTVKAVGNVTRALCDLRPSQRIGLRGPFGRGWPLEQANGRELLLIAGGIGLAPLRPVLYAALEAPKRYARITVLLGARSPQDLLFTEELQRWKSHTDLQFLASVDNADANWQGDVGVITQLIPRIEMNPKNVLAMICGPEVMIRFCAKSLRDRGVPADAIYVSLERNMKCALGICGHCQLGPHFLCRNGPVFGYAEVERFLMTREF
ncbi:FAD/NAD(P)-binding protein [Congregibacter variabilis]|uniref:FAD/NAD(P)-binding protein n=1 Tax=Congregibacter variabilis TaxID=3081200 RepID=A0ABZ0I0V9_9GAMM|nr:FAD/NAD(P)-binding protein [Congregibacter sp. IMCC43200]